MVNITGKLGSDLMQYLSTGLIPLTLKCSLASAYSELIVIIYLEPSVAIFNSTGLGLLCQVQCHTVLVHLRNKLTDGPVTILAGH